MIHDHRLLRFVARHPYPLLFASLSGAHLYGFASPDSDFDLRGIHLLPLRDLVGLRQPVETVEKSEMYEGLEIDLVTHDARKFFGLLLNKNGYVLEQVLSPLVLKSTPYHAELQAIARSCITRQHGYHYLGFANNQWELWQQEPKQRLKPLLYVYRVLLTGIFLMKTGELEANLENLNQFFKLPYLPDYIAQKREGTEDQALVQADRAFHQQEYARLRAVLVDSQRESRLHDNTQALAALDDLLVRIRLDRR